MPQPHPVKAVLAMRRISVVALAAHAKDPAGRRWRADYIGRCINGHSRPSPELARAVAVVLAEPVEMLWRPDALASAPTHPGDRLLGGVA